MLNNLVWAYYDRVRQGTFAHMRHLVLVAPIVLDCLDHALLRRQEDVIEFDVIQILERLASNRQRRWGSDQLFGSTCEWRVNTGCRAKSFHFRVRAALWQ